MGLSAGDRSLDDPGDSDSGILEPRRNEAWELPAGVVGAQGAVDPTGEGGPSMSGVMRQPEEGTVPIPLQGLRGLRARCWHASSLTSLQRNGFVVCALSHLSSRALGHSVEFYVLYFKTYKEPTRLCCVKRFQTSDRTWGL